MNIFTIKLFSLLLCLVMLCGCAAENATSGDQESGSAPSAENNAQTDKDTTGTADDESGSEPQRSPIATLTSEEVGQWEAYFNTLENNGLLRFPYEGLDSDPDQLAPYLHRLFYDIGDHESEFSDEEKTLLNEAGLWLELDAFRLSREFMNGYLYEHLNIPAKDTENLLDAAKIGIYLLKYDAWYIAHGDTEYSSYKIDRGEVYEDGTIKLYYFNNFLSIQQENGEIDFIDANMVIVLSQREDGSRYISAHRIEKD